ncbi:MAG: hypothetical protein HYX47_22925 [Burkholderiales bacterium]|nr:hypothetical protein [Burkholderiales bacterium]
MLETLAAAASAATLATAIITTDSATLRAAPRDSAQQQAMLRQGDLIEVRGERLDYLQVYDHRRERAGFVRASQVRRTSLAAAEAPELLSVVRFVRDTPGSEALGIAFAAAWLKAAPAQAVQGAEGVEAFDAMGSMADRLARRASAGAALGKQAEQAVAAHLEVVAQYGVRFASYERDGRMQVCYDGEAFRRVLAMQSVPAQRARAALALTQPECMDPKLRPMEHRRLDEWRAEVLERVDATALPGYLKNRVLMRRASVFASLAYERTREGVKAEAAAERALAELAGVNRNELTDIDLPEYNDAAMRVNASRWAAGPAMAAAAGKGPAIVTVPGEAGQTCVLLVDAKNDEKNPLARRCTYSLVWAASATLNREGNALALAVQPLEAWRELWLFRKEAGGWTLNVLPPATTGPDLGYAEFAGWVPGGKQVLVAREARGEGKYRRSYELVSIASLATERQSGEPDALGVFQRWQDPAWKRLSAALR